MVRASNLTRSNGSGPIKLHDEKIIIFYFFSYRMMDLPTIFFLFQFQRFELFRIWRTQKIIYGKEEWTNNYIDDGVLVWVFLCVSTEQPIDVRNVFEMFKAIIS